MFQQLLLLCILRPQAVFFCFLSLLFLLVPAQHCTDMLKQYVSGLTGATSTKLLCDDEPTEHIIPVWE